MPAPLLTREALGERILGDLTTSVLVLDERYKVVYMNPAAEELFAISSRQAAGFAFQELVVHSNGLPGHVQQAVASGRSLKVRELSLETVGGRGVTVDCAVTPLSVTGHGREVLIELLELDRRLRINREESRLAQHNAAHDLVRRLAHEIKNPLGGLRGAAQLLEEELDDDLLEYTGIIIREADRLQALVDRLLGPNQLPRKRATNLHEILEHVCNLIKVEGGNEIGFVRDYDPSAPALMADRDMLIQAILNVMRNAVQAMEGSGRLTLRTRVKRQFTIEQRRHKLVLQLDVIDTGPGIEADLLETIFYPMVTGRDQGTGLGLSIAESLISRHGGLITCASKPGETVFSMFFPLELSE